MIKKNKFKLEDIRDKLINEDLLSLDGTTYGRPIILHNGIELGIKGLPFYAWDSPTEFFWIRNAKNEVIRVKSIVYGVDYSAIADHKARSVIASFMQDDNQDSFHTSSGVVIFEILDLIRDGAFNHNRVVIKIAGTEYKVNSEGDLVGLSKLSNYLTTLLS